jgi:hypothetical protein
LSSERSFLRSVEGCSVKLWIDQDTWQSKHCNFCFIWFLVSEYLKVYEHMRDLLVYLFLFFVVRKFILFDKIILLVQHISDA